MSLFSPSLLPAWLTLKVFTIQAKVATTSLVLKLDINLTSLSSLTSNWKDVGVIGKLRESDKEWKIKLLRLGRYMRNVFATEPTCRLVKGFTLLGSIMELWVFDRSGPYSLGVLNIHKEPEQFIRSIARYTMMSHEELGWNTFTSLDEGYRSIMIIEDTTGKKRRLQLESDPIAYQRAIVCCGTSCFCARTLNFKNLQYVAKFFWVSDKG